MSFHRLLVSIAVDEKSDSQMFPNHLSNQGSGLCKYGPITAQPTQQGSCVSLVSFTRTHRGQGFSPLYLCIPALGVIRTCRSQSINAKLN